MHAFASHQINSLTHSLSPFVFSFSVVFCLHANVNVNECMCILLLALEEKKNQFLFKIVLFCCVDWLALSDLTFVSFVSPSPCTK